MPIFQAALQVKPDDLSFSPQFAMVTAQQASQLSRVSHALDIIVCHHVCLIAGQ